MKCRLLVEREVMEFHPGTTIPHAPPELVAQCERRDGRLFAPVGAIIDDPNCFWIVLNGQAEAWDEECAARTKCSSEALAARLHAAKRLAAGIEPSDWDLFDAGAIVGYDAEGKYLPGPNWAEYEAQERGATPSASTRDEGI